MSVGAGWVGDGVVIGFYIVGLGVGVAIVGSNQ